MCCGCKNDCGKCMANDIAQTFMWTNESFCNFHLWYDKQSEEIVIDENALLRIMMMVNPSQKPRKIAVVSREELEQRKRRGRH